MTSQELRQAIENIGAKATQIDAQIGALAVAALDGQVLKPGQVAGLLADKYVGALQLVELQRRLVATENSEMQAEWKRLDAEAWRVRHEMDSFEAQHEVLDAEWRALPPGNLLAAADVRAKTLPVEARWNLADLERKEFSRQADNLRDILRERGVAVRHE